MSSIVNKSSVRFTPKLKQRRSTSVSTPKNLTDESNASSSVSTPIITPQPTQESPEREDSENDSEEDPITEQAPTQSRRSSIIGAQETKQRRLSTLSNTARFEFKKIPFVENEKKPQVIGIPLPSVPATGGRKRGSVRKVTKKSKESSTSVVIGLPTPSSTQESTQKDTQTEENIDKTNKDKPTETEVIQKSTNEEGMEMEEPSTNSASADTTIKAPVAKPITIEKTSTSEIPSNKAKTIVFENPRTIENDPDDLLPKDNSKKLIGSFKEIKGALNRVISHIDDESNELEANIGQELNIDEDSFTMAELCKPTIPIGKTSSNFKLAEKARSARMEVRKNKRIIRIRAKAEKRSLESFEEGDKKEEKKKIRLEELLEDNTPAAANAIQLKVNADGSIAIDEESRVLDRHATADISGFIRHNENPFENVVNSATYGKQRYTDKWDDTEVRRLYEGLSQWGTDFGLISQMFPHRTRRQVKAKFIAEEKKRPRAVELALARKLNFTFDLEVYSDHANKTFSELDQFNEKLVKLKEEHEQNLKELTIAREKAKEEDLERQKKREFEVKTGQRTMTRQERMTELRKHETVLGSIDDIKKQREEEEDMPN